MIHLFLFSLLFISSAAIADLNDTATSTNILPNANVTSSSMDQFDLDGVSTSYGTLSNNSTINGFTITCDTQVNNNCGSSFNGELEASHDMTVSASGSLVGIVGTDESGNSHTSTQKKLDGGIELKSTFSVQNCEHSNSAWACGNSAGAIDSYTNKVVIKDSDGAALATVNQTRTDDAGYYSNSKQFTDSVVHNGTGANNYEWSWTGVDGSGNTSSSTMGTNLLGAELVLNFPTEAYEPLSQEEIESINNQLETINLNENEIWDVISGIEAGIENEIYEITNTHVSVSLEENLQIEIYQPTNQIEEAAIEEIITFIEEEKIETIKEEITAKIEEKIETKKEEIKKEEKIVEKEEVEENEETEIAKTKEEKTKEIKKGEINETEKETETKVLEKVEIKISDNVKIDIKEVKLFDNPDSLNEYQEVSLYKSDDLYIDNTTDIFFQNDLTLYSKDVYLTFTLDNYINIDPLSIRDAKLYELKIKKMELMIDLKKLKELL